MEWCIRWEWRLAWRLGSFHSFTAPSSSSPLFSHSARYIYIYIKVALLVARGQAAQCACTSVAGGFLRVHRTVVLVATWRDTSSRYQLPLVAGGSPSRPSALPWWLGGRSVSSRPSAAVAGGPPFAPIAVSRLVGSRSFGFASPVCGGRRCSFASIAALSWAGVCSSRPSCAVAGGSPSRPLPPGRWPERRLRVYRPCGASFVACGPPSNPSCFVGDQRPASAPFDMDGMEKFMSYAHTHWSR